MWLSARNKQLPSPMILCVLFGGESNADLNEPLYFCRWPSQDNFNSSHFKFIQDVETGMNLKLFQITCTHCQILDFDVSLRTLLSWYIRLRTATWRTIPLSTWLRFQLNTFVMKPFQRTILVIASHHSAVRFLNTIKFCLFLHKWAYKPNVTFLHKQ